MDDDESRRIKLAASCNSSVRNDCSGFNWNNPEGSAHTYPVAPPRRTLPLSLRIPASRYPARPASCGWCAGWNPMHAGLLVVRASGAGVAAGWRVLINELLLRRLWPVSDQCPNFRWIIPRCFAVQFQYELRPRFHALRPLTARERVSVWIVSGTVSISQRQSDRPTL